MHNDPHEDVQYLACMCDELAGLAESRQLSAGAYLLRMASLEFRLRQERFAATPSAQPPTH